MKNELFHLGPASEYINVGRMSSNALLSLSLLAVLPSAVGGILVSSNHIAVCHIPSDVNIHLIVPTVQ